MMLLRKELHFLQVFLELSTVKRNLCLTSGLVFDLFELLASLGQLIDNAAVLSLKFKCQQLHILGQTFDLTFIKAFKGVSKH